MDLEDQIVFVNVMVDEPQAMFDKCKAFYEARKSALANYRALSKPAQEGGK